jgi:hypothetical protein
MTGNSKHQCLIYKGSPSGHLANLANILAGKLKSNHRCIYLHSPSMVEEMRACLCGLGLDVAKEVEKGSLILTSDQTHLEEGRFNPERMLNFMRNAVKQAVADGYAALWATGDMAWEFGGKINISKLFDYEYALEEFFQETPHLYGICQYHRDTLPPYALQAALTSHKDIWLNETLVQNPHYMQVRDSLSPADLDNDIENLASLSMAQARS